MEPYQIVLFVLGGLLLVIFVAGLTIGIVGTFIIFGREKKVYTPHDLQPTSPFLAYQEAMVETYDKYVCLDKKEIWIENGRKKKLHAFLTTSETNHQKEKPTVIIFSHGYHSTGSVDLCFTGGWFLKDYDALVIDQEGHGQSEGNHIGFGIYDSENIVLWVNKVNEMYHENVNIVLYGISMGANTLLLAGDKTMQNVKGILADCAYTSTFDMCKEIVKTRYFAFWICLISSLYIHRNVFRYSSLKTVRCTLYPILFIHGGADTFVPTWMSEKNAEACSNTYGILTIPGAYHALSYLVDKDAYLSKAVNFVNEITK